MRNLLNCVISLLLLSLTVSGKEKKIELPVETQTYKKGRGVELAMTYCYTCHAVEYVSTQPPMPRKFWESTVIKMKEKFGAPIPQESVEDLVNYFTETYGKK